MTTFTELLIEDAKRGDRLAARVILSVRQHVPLWEEVQTPRLHMCLRETFMRAHFDRKEQADL